MIKNSKIRSLLRYLIKRLLPLIGFQNLLLIFERQINEEDTVAEVDNEYEYKIYQYPFSLDDDYTDCGDLKKHIANLTRNSVLAIAIDKKQVVGYMWAHYDFDPLKEIETDINSFVVIGPSFVIPTHRGNNISKYMRGILLREAYSANYRTIISKTGFDNIPQIKAAMKAGYKIHHIMYKIEGRSYYL